MIVRQTIKIGRPLTEEELEEIRALKGRPIVFDEDCPELTEEELRQFKRVNPIRRQANDNG